MSITAITNSTSPLVRPLGDQGRPSPVDQAKEVRDVFRDFVGETFYRQMLKSMRSSVGKPAYFYGGRGEEVFTQRLDETLAETLSKANGSDFSDRMFAQAFPQLAAVLREAEAAGPPERAAGGAARAPHPNDINMLAALPRR